jgi:hypothetical protein
MDFSNHILDKAALNLYYAATLIGRAKKKNKAYIYKEERAHEYRSV